jgi:hypothetical protein
MQRSRDVDVRAMMRGWTPLFVVVATLLLSGHALAQNDDDDGPTPVAPAPPSLLPLPPVPPPLIAPMPIVCCIDPRPPTRALYLTLSVGPSYRRAFGDDFIAVMPELEVGAQSSAVSIATRLSAALGATRVGLPFQYFSIGPSFMFRMSPRWRFGFALDFGFMLYERATVVRDDPVVWSPALGLALDLTADLWRARSGGTLFVDARLGSDYVFTLRESSFVEGLTVTPSVGLGWRL